MRVLRDLRSLKATTGTMSSSLVSGICEVLVPTGNLMTSSTMPLFTGSVFSFGWASCGKFFAGTDLCLERMNPFSQGQAVWLSEVELVSSPWILYVRHKRPQAMYFSEN